MSYLFKHYAGIYDDFMRKFRLDKNEEIIKNIDSIHNKKILDLGGGTGTLSDLLQYRGADVTLVDPSIEMTKEARKKNKHIKIHSKTLQELEEELEKGCFDIVILRDALHHMGNPSEIMAHAYEYLNEEGRILIWEFNSKSFRAKLIWLFETLCFERCHRFSEESLSHLCNPYFEKETLKLTSKFEMLYKRKKKSEKELL